jgi:hypothetical protein
MTAKRWPVLETLSPNRNSLPAGDPAVAEKEVSRPRSRAERVGWDSCCSIGLTPGVPGIIGVDVPEGG